MSSYNINTSRKRARQYEPMQQQSLGERKSYSLEGQPWWLENSNSYENQQVEINEQEPGLQPDTSYLAKYWCSALGSEPVQYLRQYAQELGINDYNNLTKRELCETIAQELKTNVDEIPEEFQDPITYELINDPILLSDGYI